MATQTGTICPGCGVTGKSVDPVTVQALIAGPPSIAQETWRFCDSPDCETVYFSDDGCTYSKEQLTVQVGVKETTGERPLCYCFGHSVASMKDELQAKGHSDALQDIRAKMKDPGCSCETKNPSGSCCLGSVAKGIETARAELNRPANRMGTLARVGTVLSAVVASSCCWLPLLLLAGGVSGAGIGATLETWRPLFVVTTIGFLGAAFYLTYRPHRAAPCCEHGGDCGPPAGRFNKAMLWGVTVLALGFLFFPSYAGMLIGTDDQISVTAGMDGTVLQIEGMTCAGCATTVAQAIRRVPGVTAVEVSHQTGRAVIATDSHHDIPVPDILDVLKQAGFQGHQIDVCEHANAQR